MHDHHEHHEHHSHAEITPAVLLAHMAEHNRSHNEELAALAEKLESPVREKVLAAAEMLKKGNEMLKEALRETEK